MPSPSTYPKNAWYVAALSREVDGEGLFHRRILSTSVVLYRDTAGGLVALHDRCPHRFAPLSMGRHDGNDVICPYHGLRFNSEGRCVHNPHGKGHIPPAAAVRRFPAAERQGLIWIWMGDGPADQDALPDFAPLAQGHANGLGLTYMKLPVNYRMILDNVMDLSHVDYVHGEIISTRGQLSPLFPKVEDSDRHVSARWEWTQTPPMLIFNQFLPRPEDAAEHFVQVSWSAPANIQLSVGAVQDGKPFEEGASQYDLHCCTPEDEGSTHYFFATRRDHIEDDGEYNAFKIKAMHDAFELEDGPIIAAAEREMGGEDFFDLNPVLMSNDLAPVKVRRALQKLVAAEYHGGDVPASGVKVPDHQQAASHA